VIQALAVGVSRRRGQQRAIGHGPAGEPTSHSCRRAAAWLCLIVLVWAATHELMVAADNGSDSTTQSPVQEQCVPPIDQPDIDFYLLATNGDLQQLHDIEAAICHPQ
jgi:hypothetical protein